MEAVKNRDSSPAWQWLLATVFLFPLLPEYISPFVLFAGFIVFKVQWSKEGRKAKVGTLGKICMAFMSLALLSILWSDTKLDSLGTAGLWWGMFLVLVMINNLANTKEKIDEILKAVSASAALNGAIGTIQICSYLLHRDGYIGAGGVLVNPIYKNLDKFVYTKLPFEIRTNTFADRASGFFSNPNLMTSYLVFAYPLSIYLYLNSKTKKQKIFYLFSNLLISAGISSTMTRAGCVIALAGWLFMFIVLIKRHGGRMLQIFVPTVCIIIPSLLTRYGIIFAPKPKPNGASHSGGAEAAAETAAQISAAVSAKQSSANHFKIWGSIIDYLADNLREFFFGLGFGCESTGNMLLEEYGLDKPHAHNFILEIWAELGLIGLIILLVLIGAAIMKLFKTKAPNGKRYDLIFYIFTSFMMFLCFGLSDYIFNSPKQIILIMISLGLIQAISSCYEQNEITKNDFEKLKKHDNAHKKMPQT